MIKAYRKPFDEPVLVLEIDQESAIRIAEALTYVGYHAGTDGLLLLLDEFLSGKMFGAEST